MLLVWISLFDDANMMMLLLLLLLQALDEAGLINGQELIVEIQVRVAKRGFVACCDMYTHTH